MKTSQVLSYMGLIPFFMSLFMSLDNTLWQVNTQYIFIAYSAIILSFVSGTLWQGNQTKQHDVKKIVSNLICLFAFLALFLAQHLSLILLAINYLCLFVYEYRISKQLNQQSHREVAYMKMRFKLTIIIVLLHIIALMRW